MQPFPPTQRMLFYCDWWRIVLLICAKRVDDFGHSMWCQRWEHLSTATGADAMR
jgi:hypothetical protein